MNFDWRGRVILAKLAEGSTMRESAEAAGISRQAVLKRVNASPAFDQAVATARETGKEACGFATHLEESALPQERVMAGSLGSAMGGGEGSLVLRADLMQSNCVNGQ
jgi:hypothetical protein